MTAEKVLWEINESADTIESLLSINFRNLLYTREVNMGSFITRHNSMWECWKFYEVLINLIFNINNSRMCDKMKSIWEVSLENFI